MKNPEVRNIATIMGLFLAIIIFACTYVYRLFYPPVIKSSLLPDKTVFKEYITTNYNGCKIISIKPEIGVTDPYLPFYPVKRYQTGRLEARLKNNEQIYVMFYDGDSYTDPCLYQDKK